MLSICQTIHSDALQYRVNTLYMFTICITLSLSVMSCLDCLTHTTSEETCYIRSSCEDFAMSADHCFTICFFLVQLFVSLFLSRIVFQTLLPWWTFYTALFVYGKYYLIKKSKHGPNSGWSLPLNSQNMN